MGEFDPLAQGKSNVRELGDAWVESPVLGGYVRREGDLTVRGDAHLDGAVLFVDGDLDIRGGLEGRGAIFVTGSTRIVGSANLRTDNAASPAVSAGEVATSFAVLGVLYGILAVIAVWLFVKYARKGPDPVGPDAESGSTDRPDLSMAY